jgi:hypothetical protein
MFMLHTTIPKKLKTNASNLTETASLPFGESGRNITDVQILLNQD